MGRKVETDDKLPSSEVAENVGKEKHDSVFVLVHVHPDVFRGVEFLPLNHCQ